MTRQRLQWTAMVIYYIQVKKITTIRRQSGLKIGLFQFANPAGLDKTGDSLLMETEASGIALNEDIDDVGEKEYLKAGLSGSFKCKCSNRNGKLDYSTESV